MFVWNKTLFSNILAIIIQFILPWRDYFIEHLVVMSHKVGDAYRRILVHLFTTFAQHFRFRYSLQFRPQVSKDDFWTKGMTLKTSKLSFLKTFLYQKSTALTLQYWGFSLLPQMLTENLTIATITHFWNIYLCTTSNMQVLVHIIAIEMIFQQNNNLVSNYFHKHTHTFQHGV